MPVWKATIIDPPTDRPVMEPSEPGPVVRGSGGSMSTPINEYRCGNCGLILMEGPGITPAVTLVVKCFGCNLYNDMGLLVKIYTGQSQ